MECSPYIKCINLHCVRSETNHQREIVKIYRRVADPLMGNIMRTLLPTTDGVINQ